MGESSAQTVREIEEIRDRLDSDIRELENRLPPPAVWGKRLLGVAAGGGLGGAAFWFAVRRLRGRKEQKRKEARRVPAQAVLQVLPEDVAERVAARLEEGEWKRWLAIGAGLWMAVRLVELRQLRKMNKSFARGAL